MVLEFAGVSATQKSNWKCRCDCGRTTVSNAGQLNDGTKKSCGCFQRDRAAEKCTTHGKTGTPEHRAWTDMKARVKSKHPDIYVYYGARGIKVCDRWMDFENFLADMGKKPSPKHSLDRMDSNGHYEPGNCKWSTPKQQSRNTRRNHFVELDGQKVTIAEAAERLGTTWQQAHAKLSGKH